jgi:hypothetical protein
MLSHLLKPIAYGLVLALVSSAFTTVLAQSQNRMHRPSTSAPKEELNRINEQRTREILDEASPNDEAPQTRRASAAFIGNTTTLPAGTLIITEMLTPISSKTASAGDRLRAKVIQPVNYQGRVVIPAGSIIEGQVQDVARARSRRRPGMIEISFDRLRLADNSTVPLDAVLAPAAEEDRKRISEDGSLQRRGNGIGRTAAFVGGGAGAGAVIGYVAGGALLGAGIGAGVGVAIAVLGKGHEAEVPAGMKIGAELQQPIQVRTAANPEVAVESAQPGLSPYKPTKGTEDVASTQHEDNPNEVTTTPRPKQPAKAAPKPSGGATKPVTPAVKPAAPKTTPLPRGNEPDDANVERGSLELLSITNVLAERGSDDTVRVSLTAQTPTAGWKLVPEDKIQNGVLQIKVLGAPPRSLAAQVISSATTVIVKPDPDRLIQRVSVRGANGERTTVPMVRGERGGGAATPTGSGEALSAAGLRIADKTVALTEDYARSMRAWKQADGQYSFENPRSGGTPEAQLLFAFDRLSEAANVFRGSLTADAKRRAVRDLNNSNAQVNRLWPYVKVPVEFKTRWEEIERESKQLAASVPGGTATPAQPRRTRG